MVKLSSEAKKLLKRIGKTDDASMRLTKGNAKSAQELKDAGLSILIYLALGGAYVALTQAGCDAFDSMK